MVQSQPQNQSIGWCHLCAPNHPRSPMPALSTCPGCQKVETELCVCIPTGSCVVVCSSNRQFCLFQVHISWPRSHWPVATPTLAAQPAVSFFPLIKHALLFLKLHWSKSQHVMGILDRRLGAYCLLTGPACSMEQTRNWWCNVCFISKGRWTNLTFSLQNLKLQHSQCCLPKTTELLRSILKKYFAS